MVVIRGLPGRRTVFALLLAAIVAGAPMSAQQSESSGAPEGARRVLLFLATSDDARYTARELGLVRDSLLAALASYRDTVAVVEWSATESGREQTRGGYTQREFGDRERTELAFENGCDIWLAVSIDGSSDAPAYGAYALDLVTRKAALDLEVAGGAALRTRDLARRFWADLVDALVADLETPELGTRVTFTGVSGTRIAGITDEEIELDEDGTASLTLPNPNVFSWRAVRLGYDIKTGVLEVGDEPKTVALDQERAPRNQVDAGLSTLNYFSASYARYIFPGYLFARAGVVTYVVGYSFLASETQRISLVSEPLSHLSLQLAGYFIAPDRRVRAYAGISGGLRIVHSRLLFGLEPIAPVTAGVLAGAELKLLPRLSGWFELNPTILFARDPRILAGSIDSDVEGVVIPNIGIGLLDVLRFSAGVRYRW